MMQVKSIASGFFWNQIGRTFEFLISFLFTALIAKILGAEINGIYASLLSLVFLLTIISSFGLETSINSRFPKYFQSDTDLASRTVYQLIIFRAFLSLLIAAILYLSRFWIIDVLNVSNVVLDYILFVILFFTFKNIISLLNSILISFFLTFYSAAISVTFRFIEFVIALYLLKNNYSLQAIFILLAGTNFLHLLVLLVFFVKSFSLKVNKDVRTKEILSLGVKLWLNSIFEFLLGKQAVILLLGIFAITSFMIGNFDASFALAQVLNSGLTIGFFGVSIAAFSALEERGKEVLRKYWDSLNHFVLVIIIPAFIYVIFFAQEVIYLIYSEEYLSGVFWLQIFSLTFLLTRVIGGGIAADYLMSRSMVKSLLKASIISGFLNLTLSILLIKYIGALGGVIALCVSLFVVSSLHFCYLKSEFNPSIPVSFVIKILTISLISLGVASLVYNFMFEQKFILSFIVYILLFVSLSRIVKPFTQDDIENIKRVNPRIAQIFKNFASTKKLLTDRQKWAFSWLEPSNLIVDIGCSNTPLVKSLLLKSKNVIGVDIDFESLNFVKCNPENMWLLQASAENIPLKSKIADAVLLLDVIEHVDNESMVISEAWRLLKEDGTLILSVPYKGLFSFLDPQNLSQRRRGNKFQKKHKHYSYNDLRRLFFRLFKIEKVHYGGLFLYPVSFGLANFFIKHFSLDLRNFFKTIGDIDNDISWGRLSYNIIIKAKRI